jgi:glycosyltransferase involved in cell wall biosynthesis
MESATGARGLIVYLTSSFEPEIGGTVSQTSSNARELVARGYSVTVLTVMSRDDLSRQEQRGGVRILRFGSWKGRAGWLRAMIQWGRWLARHRDTVSIVQAVMHPDYLWCAVAVGLRSRALMLWVTRGDAESTLGPADTLLGRLMAFARRAAVRRAASNVVLTPVMRAEVARYTASEPVIIPVSVDGAHFAVPTSSEREDARSRLGLSDADVLLLFTGHVDPRKGLHHLIEALASIPRTDVRLCVVGGASAPNETYAARLREHVSELGLADRIDFVGYRSDVRDPFLWAADVFVLPSEREGMPNAVLEAMSCGLPCILPDPAGGAEVIGPEFGVIPVDNSPEALAAAIEAMLQRQDEWPTMRQRARTASEEYSVEKVADRYLDAYGLPSRGRSSPVLAGVP